MITYIAPATDMAVDSISPHHTQKVPELKQGTVTTFEITNEYCVGSVELMYVKVIA